MKKINACLIAGAMLGFSFMSCKSTQPSASSEIKKATKLVWSDEFNTNGLPDSTKWGYDLGTGCPENCGWGNNELEYYTKARSENARVVDGKLIIEVRKEKWESMQYTSARLVTKNKGDWKYGRIEAKAKIPRGVGTWSAIWMLPTDWKYGGWPASGEIDIMENVGFMPDSIIGTVHTQAYNGMMGTQKTKGHSVPDCDEKFHVYAIEWRPDKIDYYIDDTLYYTVLNEHKTFAEWPFDQRFHLILNIAVGGNWGGTKGVDDSIWPQKMELDYVRVYAF